MKALSNITELVDLYKELHTINQEIEGINKMATQVANDHCQVDLHLHSIRKVDQQPQQQPKFFRQGGTTGGYTEVFIHANPEMIGQKIQEAIDRQMEPWKYNDQKEKKESPISVCRLISENTTLQILAVLLADRKKAQEDVSNKIHAILRSHQTASNYNYK